MLFTYHLFLFGNYDNCCMHRAGNIEALRLCIGLPLFQGSSNKPTDTCALTLWKCEGQCANCGDCSFITSTNSVPIRLENPQNSEMIFSNKLS